MDGRVREDAAIKNQETLRFTSDESHNEYRILPQIRLCRHSEDSLLGSTRVVVEPCCWAIGDSRAAGTALAESVLVDKGGWGTESVKTE